MFRDITIDGINVAVKTLHGFAFQRLREDVCNGDKEAEELAKGFGYGARLELKKIEAKYQDQYERYIENFVALYKIKCNYVGESLGGG